MTRLRFHRVVPVWLSVTATSPRCVRQYPFDRGLRPFPAILQAGCAQVGLDRDNEAETRPTPVRTSVPRRSSLQASTLRTRRAPTRAPRKRASVEVIRAPMLEPEPPAIWLSADIPVMAWVTTDVVIPGMASLNARAFCRPMASPSTTMRLYLTPPAGDPFIVEAMTVAIPNSTASIRLLIVSR